MICSADCAHYYEERKKILQMKEWNSSTVELMGNSKETLSLPARGDRHLACRKVFLHYFKGVAKNTEKISKGNWRLTLTCNIHSQRK